MSSNPGFDWLNLAALKSDSDLPPPPVSFGFTPTSSSSSVNLADTATVSGGSSISNLNERLQTSLDDVNSPSNLDSSSTFEETPEDLTVPLDLRPEDLSPEEAKTYLRWYNDIILTRGTRLIRLNDVFGFLSNFKLSKHVKHSIEKIFRQCVSLNVGEFFALLRVISHALKGDKPRRKLIQFPAPLLRPRSILSGRKPNKHPREEDESDSALSSGFSSKNTSKLDLDTFTQFILTGEKPSHTQNNKAHKNKKTRRVKFSDEVSVEPTYQEKNVDISLPMGELLGKVPHINIQRPTFDHEQPSFINEEEELRDMQEEVNHFQHVKNVDSALIHGNSSNIPSIFFDEARFNTPSPDFNQSDLLKPNNTGPMPGLLAQNSTGPIVGLMPPNNTGPVPGLLPPNNTGPVPGLLPPNHTGPVPFANSLLSSSYGLQASPQPQHTGGYLSPGSTGPVPLQPAATGSLSSSMRLSSNYDVDELRAGSVSPMGSSLVVPTINNRNRSASSPIPYHQEQQPSIADQLQEQYNVQQQHHQYNTQQNQRVTSPVPPPPPPTRRQRNSSAPMPPPSRTQAPPLPPKVSLEPQYTNGYQTPSPQPVNHNNPYALQSNNSGSVYDRVLQDFTANGTPVNGAALQSGPGNAPNGHSFGRTSSTSDILGDLKALQSEVDRLQYFQ